MWRFCLFGGIEAISPSGTPAHVHGKKTASLLAYLALNRNRPVSRHYLQDLLWPDADGDRQYQSLRRAVSDLRDDLGDDPAVASLLKSDQGSLMLEPDSFTTDVGLFTELLAGSVDLDALLLRGIQALALYRGPLLSLFEDEWIYPYRRQYEEMYCRALEEVTRLLVQKGQHHDAQRIASAAIVLAPLREEPFHASILAYSSAGNESMATQQFEALEHMLDEHFGQTPSDAAIRALEHAPRQDLTRPQVVMGGAVDPDSRFYIEREADSQVADALESDNALVLVFGPRQVGKTSLVARSTEKLQKKGVRVVVTDLQSLGKTEIGRVTTLYRALAHSFATELGLEYEPTWNEDIGPNWNLDAKISALLSQVDGPVCWAMDEADRLFSTDYADDFFGLVRSWHNRRAFSNKGPWKNLKLAICYATEAHLFITDLNQSPFNIGVRVNLTDFTESEVADLASRHEPSLVELASSVFGITRGHPYLSRKAFGYLQAGRAFEDLQRTAPSADGPFGDHLRHLERLVLRESHIFDAVRCLLKTGRIGDVEVTARLAAAGVVVTSPSGETAFRVPVYQQFLERVLM